MTTTIFLNNVTVIDHAFIDKKGRVIGGSYNANFYLSGKPTDDESVVLDFSKAKKRLKAIVDAKEDGFDHKLWVIPGFSKAEVVSDGGYSTIFTPAIKLRVPNNAVHVLPELRVGYLENSPESFRLFDSHIAEAIQQKIMSEFAKDEALAGIDVQVFLDVEPVIALPNKTNWSTTTMFRYSHGLKDSSSWGCQNVAHGHYSFAAITHKMSGQGRISEVLSSALSETTEHFNNAMFVMASNAHNMDEELPGILNFGYETERGEFKVSVNTAAMKVIVVHSETTIEYLLRIFREEFVRRVRAHYDAKPFDIAPLEVELYISEGMTKGSCEAFKLEWR